MSQCACSKVSIVENIQWFTHKCTGIPRLAQLMNALQKSAVLKKFVLKDVIKAC